jgi:SAM-dependent methyltransferase
VAFWRHLAADHRGLVLELGCGTGRIAVPLLKAGTPVVGIDRSDAMLDRARRRARRAGVAPCARFVRGDIRDIPLRSSRFDLVMAPYGILQSLTRERDLQSTLESVARVVRRGGVFGIDLVPDLPRWHEYKRKLSLHGRRSATTTLTLIESVRQDRRRRLTIFDQEYIERRGHTRRVHHFALTFRTLSVPQMVSRLEAAGFSIRAIFGDYQGTPWDERADVWVILAGRK